MKNNKAFTLTEIIAVIAIIGVVLTIAIPAVSNMISNNKQKEYMLYVETVEKAVLAYADMECPPDDTYTVKISSLEIKGYLQKNTNIPDNTIKFKKSPSGKIEFIPSDLKLSFADGMKCTKTSCD